jgi:putative transposase
MYSYTDRIRAVKFYINCGFNAAYTVRKLGYPDATSLKHWYKEYLENDTLHEQKVKYSKYTDHEKRVAVDYYYKYNQNALRTVLELGYPSRPLLMSWVKELNPNHAEEHCKVFKSHVRCSHEEQIKAVIESCKGILTVREIADIYKVTPSAVSIWRKKLLGERRTISMEKSQESNKDVGQLLKEMTELEEKVKSLEKDVYRLQLERDVLEKAGEILKKEKGIDLKDLTNYEKVILINALRNKYKLNQLLPMLSISKSSYCYQKNVIAAPDKYSFIRNKIKDVFVGNKKHYGYRRIHQVLHNEGITISEKIVRKIMKEENLIVPLSKHRKYTSYKGEISPDVNNIIARDFHAEQPNKKWLTDITEFHISAGKVYLSAIIDCFDGLAVSWTIGTSPDSVLANTMLDNAIEQLKPWEKPIVHSDRGCHYRWPGWIERMNAANLTRSMSKKGCSPDNSACEGFFGRLKNEMFYNRSWNHVSIEDFIQEVDSYIHWYNEERIKISLGGISPLQYRRSLGLAN